MFQKIALAALVVLHIHAPIAQAQAVTAPTPRDTTGCGRQLTAEQMGAAGCIAAVEEIAMSDTSTIRMHPVINGRAVLRHDSVVVIVDSLTRRWLAALQRSHTVLPRDLMNQVALQVQIGHDADAQGTIEQWLASPGITTQDTLLALTTGIALFTTTFADGPPPARLAIARSYMARLEAMPMAAAVSQLYEARFLMMGAYARAREPDSAISNGLRGFALIPHFPTYERQAAAAVNSAILELAELLVGQPGGLARVDSLLGVLHAALVPAPDLVARDTALARLAEMDGEVMALYTDKVRLLGRQMPPIIATHWFNQPTPATSAPDAPNARALRVDDGIIRIIGFGWFTCGWCGVAMKQLQLDQALLPKGVQIEFYEWTLGYWGSDFVTPDQETEHLRQYWFGRKHYTFPIALWAGPKAGGTEADGTSGEGAIPRPSPTKQALYIEAGPTFFVTDGHGIIRHWQEGYGGYHKDLEHIINILLSEREHHMAPLNSATPTPSVSAVRSATSSSSPSPLVQ